MIENLSPGGGGGGTVDTIQAGTGISVDATDAANPIITNTSLNTDETAKVSSNDTTAGYLNGKLVAGTNVTFTENNDGGNETLTIAATDTNDAAKVSSNDTTAGYLNGKLVAGSGISFTEGNDGGNETLTIANSSAGDATYSVTLADCENTLTKTKIATFTVPANTWASGETVKFELITSALNNSGNALAPVQMFVEGTTITTRNGAAFAPGIVSNPRYNHVVLQWTRSGSGLYFTHWNVSDGTVNNYYGIINPFSTSLSNAITYDSSVTFTSDITIDIYCQLGDFSASFYVRTEAARAYKMTGGSV